MQPPQRVNSIPLFGQQQQQAQAQMQAAIGQLSMQIYSKVALSHLTTRDVHQTLDVKVLRRLSQNSILAAKCYFEGIGAIEVEEEKHDT